jgi:hypothetical protein
MSKAAEVSPMLASHTVRQRRGRAPVPSLLEFTIVFVIVFEVVLFLVGASK